jgi:chromosome segregation protein
VVSDAPQDSGDGELQVLRQEGEGSVPGRIHRHHWPKRGSGKSNIGDAVLFVLGPKSSRVIRAGKLTDLIYHGGKKHKPATYCKVSLIFDNADKVMPVGADEVKLTRLVKRSQSNNDSYNSYFYINGRPSSLAEFENVLAYGRISADGYNFVQQGDVTNIVRMGNVERRRILDNVAGITKFDKEIKRAEEKREGVEKNMDQIFIRMEEIEFQLKQLESERGIAMKYRELREKFDKAKAFFAYKKKDEVEHQLESFHKQCQKYLEDQQRLEVQKVDLRNELESLDTQIAELEQKINDKGGEEAKELKAKMDDLRLKIARAKDGIQDSNDLITELQQAISENEEEIQKCSDELQGLEDNKSTLAKETKNIEKKLAASSKELEKSESSIEESSGKAKQLRDDKAKLETELETTHDGLREAKLQQDRALAERERIESSLNELDEKRGMVEAEIKDIEWELKELKKDSKASGKSARTLQEEFMKKRAEEGNLTKEKQELEAAIIRLNREYSRVKAEADAAKAVEKGYNRAVNAVLEARDRGELKGIHGTIAELANVDDDYEKALSIAAGNRLQCVIVDSDEDAAHAIDFLKRAKLGRSVFLPLNKMMEGRPRGKALMVSRDDDSVGFAIDLVHFDEMYRSAFWYVFGDTVVVRNVKSARRMMGGARLVTTDGDLFESSGAITGGYLAAKKGLSFGASSESEIKKLGEKLSTAVARSEELGGILTRMHDELRNLENEVREASSSTDTYDIKVDTLHKNLTEFKKQRAAVKEEIDGLHAKLDAADDGLKKARSDASGLDAQMKNIQATKEKKNAELILLTPKELGDKIEALRKDVHSLTTQLTIKTSAQDTADTQIGILKDRLEEFNFRVEQYSGKVKDCKTKIKQSEKDSQSFGVEMSALQKLEDSMDKDMRGLQNQKDELYKQKISVDGQIDKVDTKIATKGDLLIQLKASILGVEEQLKQAAKELENYALTDDELKRIPKLEELTNTIQDCEGRMTSLGPVNMKAIEDYDTKSARYKELREEVRRLKDEKKNLVAVVEELDQKKKEGLYEVFEGVNQTFKEVYAELSNGGEAELLLENPDNPFEAGLLMKARPKGKKVLRLDALSGGEKSLVSMAFIFAIQRYDPSPFYVLDEIDQNLDAVNAENIAKLIKKDSSNAQFLVVSLRKVTLKESDHLYGVTLAHNGLSTVLGNVNISEVGAKGEIAVESQIPLDPQQTSFPAYKGSLLGKEEVPTSFDPEERRAFHTVHIETPVKAATPAKPAKGAAVPATG